LSALVERLHGRGVRGVFHRFAVPILPAGPATIARPASRGLFLEWRTSSNRRSAFGRRRGSASRTSATARRSRRSRSASKRRQATGIRSASRPSTASSCARSTERPREAPSTGTPRRVRSRRLRGSRPASARSSTRCYDVVRVPGRRVRSTSARCTSRSGASLLRPLSAPSSSDRRAVASRSSSGENASAWRNSFSA